MSLSIGLDLSKGKIDYFCDGLYAQLSNSKKAIKLHFKDKALDSNILMEATGKYHRLAHKTLEEMGFKVMVINPYQSKHFANAMNLLCKTDKVDAKMLSLFAERMAFKTTVCANKIQQKAQDLSRYLDDLKKVKLDLNLRSRDSDGFIKK